MAMICSAVLAKSFTLRPTNISTSIIVSMPNVTSGPGSSRATRSNVSNGGNDKSSHLSARYMTAIIGADSMTPVRAASPRLRILIEPAPVTSFNSPSLH